VEENHIEQQLEKNENNLSLFSNVKELKAFLTNSDI